MRDYIIESSKKSPFFIKGIEVKEADPLPDGVNIEGILSAIEKNFPSHYFDKLEAIIISHLDEFDERGTNAVYRDNKFYISNRLKDTNDLLDDIVHEFAHHMETLFPEMLYSDQALIREFVRKRHELNFELRSEGYWTDDYDFENLKFDKDFDLFLYKRVGTNMLKMITTGLFIRPYAAVSIREYFATGFEAFYLGKQNALEKISPILYDKISELHTYNNK